MQRFLNFRISGIAAIYLKVAAVCLAAVFFFEWMTSGIKEASEKNRYRETSLIAFQNWDVCVTAATKNELDAVPDRDSSALVEAVLLRCKDQQSAILASKPQFLEAERKVSIHNQIDRVAQVHRKNQEIAKKAEVIEAAIETLARDGISVKDLKNYFRDEILEESCND